MINSATPQTPQTPKTPEGQAEFLQTPGSLESIGSLSFLTPLPNAGDVMRTPNTGQTQYSAVSIGTPDGFFGNLEGGLLNTAGNIQVFINGGNKGEGSAPLNSSGSSSSSISPFEVRARDTWRGGTGPQTRQQTRNEPGN